MKSPKLYYGKYQLASSYVAQYNNIEGIDNIDAIKCHFLSYPTLFTAVKFVVRSNKQKTLLSLSVYYNYAKKS